MEISFDEFLSTYAPDIRDMASRLRAIVMSALPEAAERVYPGWKVISYKPGDRVSKQVCYIAPFNDYVHLGFEHGAELPDPHGVLEGKGKMMRHVTIKQAEDIEPAVLNDLISAALARVKK
jgi:hypothetical protein